jgi:hypothetical protein
MENTMEVQKLKNRTSGLGSNPVIQHLPSMCEALGSIPSTAKNQKLKNK